MVGMLIPELVGKTALVVAAVVVIALILAWRKKL